MEGLENKLGHRKGWRMSSFFNLSFTSPTSQLILKLFRRFIYITAHSPTLPLLCLRHSSFSSHTIVFTTSQALHLIHLASRPWQAEPLKSKEVVIMTLYGQLWISLVGEIWAVPIVDFAVCSRAENGGTTFRPSENTWQKRILSLVVPLLITQIRRYSMNCLFLRQLMGNPLRANFLELQMIFDNAMHGVMANADLNTNFSSAISLFSRIRPSIRAIISGVMARWTCPGRESSCCDMRLSLNLFCR